MIEGVDALTASIRLAGKVDDELLRSFLQQLERARESKGPIGVELTTAGGDADTARRIAVDLRLLRESRGERVYFVGKAAVYSAGVTIMAAFPVADRYLTRDTVLLIHERKLDKTLHVSGGLRAGVAMTRDLLAELENGQRLERQGFEELIAGSRLSLDELMAHVMKENWYVPADEAKRLGLIADLL